MAKDDRITMLLAILDQAYDRRSWNGPTLRGALRGMTPAQALWRPGKGRNRIWDLVLHCAYWKHVVRHRILGSEAEAFPRSPANWPRVAAGAGAREWRADVALLDLEHHALREAVAGMPPAFLDRRSPKKTWRYSEEIHGVASHDLYHTGQIQLIKKLSPISKRS